MLRMIVGMSVETFTRLHVAISLIALGAGFLVGLGMARNRSWPAATALFLAMTTLTTLTGFLFPFKGMTPGIVFGMLSVVALTLAFVARYGKHLAGVWRKTWIYSAVVALYLNFFVFIVQSFDKVPTLHEMGSRQKETAFAAAQLAALAAMVLLTVLALRRFKGGETAS
jgi:hypothetical protein